MPHDEGRTRMAQSIDHTNDVVGKIDHAELSQIDIVSGRMACCPAVSALVGCDNVKAQACDWDDEVSPAVGEFGKSMEKQHQWGITLSSLEEMNGKPIAVVQHT